MHTGFRMVQPKIRKLDVEHIMYEDLGSYEKKAIDHYLHMKKLNFNIDALKSYFDDLDRSSKLEYNKNVPYVETMPYDKWLREKVMTKYASDYDSNFCDRNEAVITLLLQLTINMMKEYPDKGDVELNHP